MSRRKLSRSRIEVFSRPGVRKIAEGRNPVYIDNFLDLVGFHEQRNKKEYAVVSPDAHIIPKDKVYYSATNFGKRGPLVWLNTFSGCKDQEAQEQRLMREEFSFLKARIQAWEKHRGLRDVHHVGFAWKDPRGGVHIVHPSDCIEGVRLIMDGLQSGSIEDMATNSGDKEYSAGDSHQASPAIWVPSRSRKGKGQIVLEHMTDPEDSKRHYESTYFDARHMCKSREWGGVTFGHKHKTVYCPHIGAALFKRTLDVARLKSRNAKRIILQPMPVLFSEPMLRLYLGLIYDTLKVDSEIKDNGVRFPKRELSFEETDVVLLDAWKKHGNKPTFWRGAPTKGYKPMRKYNWDSEGSGLSFSKYKEGS